MSDWRKDDVGRACRIMAEDGADEDLVHGIVSEVFRRHAVLETARKSAREISVVRDTLSFPCEVWRDPTRDEEIFMVRFPWMTGGIPHTRDEFAKWFGAEAPDTIPKV